jgi:hypothetical protein
MEAHFRQAAADLVTVEALLTQHFASRHGDRASPLALLERVASVQAALPALQAEIEQIAAARRELADSARVLVVRARGRRCARRAHGVCCVFEKLLSRLRRRLVTS